MGLAAALAATAADDPCGWTTARWGMTADQILAAVPQSQRLDQPERNGARITVPSLDLAGAKFHVWFIPDDHELLRAVVLDSGVTPPGAGFDSLFQDLENMLVEKYGRPWKSDEVATELQWSFQTTTLTLSRMKFHGQTLSVAIHYRRKDAAPI
jgi:hypothetical protein